jgi:hypothetical protein
MRSGRCPPHDGSRCEADLTCTTLLVDLEVHPPVIMRIRRHVDVSMTVELYANAHADGDVPGAAQAGGPFDAQVNSRLRCSCGLIADCGVSTVAPRATAEGSCAV